jgi:hypothetical protein
MLPLLGRERHLAAARSAFERARESRTCRFLRIHGPSGIGKSALLAAFERVVASDALVLHAAGRRIERIVPFTLANRLSPQLHATIERETHERPVLLAIDDAHWADDASLESITAIASRFTDRALLIAVVSADVDARELPAPSDRIAVEELEAGVAEQLARAVYPDAPHTVIGAIVARAGGIPYELIALARAAVRDGAREAEALALSSRAAIARRLTVLPPEQRMFLQTLSLLPEPFDRALVLELQPDRFALDRLTPEFLRDDGEALSFQHALTASAIFETIAMKIPLHRRIIAAIERRKATRLEDRILLAEQALASGDRRFAQSVLIELAFAAHAEHMTWATIWASEHHLEIGEPESARFIAFYGQFFAALMDSKQYARVEAIVAHALSEGQRRGLDGLGALAAQLVLAQWAVERTEVARASYERYAQALTDPRDLQQLRDAAPWLQAS